jgi:tyrosyl-tRNA synthetase
MGGSKARCKCRGVAGRCEDVSGVSRVGKIAKVCREGLERLLHDTTTSSEVAVVVRKLLADHVTASKEERSVTAANEDRLKNEFEERSIAKLATLCEVRLHNASIY